MPTNILEPEDEDRQDKSDNVEPEDDDSQATGDLFDDLDSLRADQDFASQGETRPVLAEMVPGKPARHEWIRTLLRPDSKSLWYILSPGKDDYLVVPRVAKQLGDDVSRVYLLPTITRQGRLFLWKIKRQKSDDRRPNLWLQTATDAASLANNQWIRVASNQAKGQYDIVDTKARIPDPEWPEASYAEMLRVCFRGRVIEDGNHEVLRQLRGDE